MTEMVESQENTQENRFLHLYKMVREREKFLGVEAKITQYNALLRYFMKFLQIQERQSTHVLAILYRTYIKLGDIYYEEALQTQDNSRYFLAGEYYNQALTYARGFEEKSRALLALKDVYYYLNDDVAFIKVEESWAENHKKEDKFAAYVLLAQNAEKPVVKANFLEKALDDVMSQDESFYTKYQDTLNVCSQLIAIYELLDEKTKAARVKKLRENTLKLLN